MNPKRLALRYPCICVYVCLLLPVPLLQLLCCRLFHPCPLFLQLLCHRQGHQAPVCLAQGKLESHYVWQLLKHKRHAGVTAFEIENTSLRMQIENQRRHVDCLWFFCFVCGKHLVKVSHLDLTNESRHVVTCLPLHSKF